MSTTELSEISSPQASDPNLAVEEEYECTKLQNFFEKMKQNRPTFVFGMFPVESHVHEKEYGNGRYYWPLLSDATESLTETPNGMVKAYRLDTSNQNRIAVSLGFDEAYYYYTLINPSRFDIADLLEDATQKRITMDFPKAELYKEPANVDVLIVLPRAYNCMQPLSYDCKCSQVIGTQYELDHRNPEGSSPPDPKKRKDAVDSDDENLSLALFGGDDAPETPSIKSDDKKKKGRMELTSSGQPASEPIAIKSSAGNVPISGTSPGSSNPPPRRGLGEFAPQSSISRSRLKELLEGLKSEGDDTRQLECLMELADFLSVATEESMGGFQTDQFVPILIQFLNYEHNPDIMLLATRSLTHLMDVQPQSCATVVQNQAVPALCAKLLSIEYIDLAEQAMQALEKLSLEHSISVLKGGGLGAVLSYLDFFPTHVQRLAVQTAANICRQVPADSFSMVIDVIPQLTNLLNYSDQKTADLALLALSRLVENIYEEPKLQQICSHGVLPHIFRLLANSVSKNSSSPSASLSSSPSTSPSGSLSGGMGGLGALNSTVITLRLTANIARGSPQLTLQLLQEGLGQVLHNMLSSSTLISEPSHPSPAGTSPNSFSPGSSPKITRSVELLSEIFSLINELLPPLPQEYILFVQPGRPLMRGPAANRSKEMEANQAAREKALRDNPTLLVHLAEALFPQLMHMYVVALQPHLRLRCLAAILKILHFSTPEHLKDLLRNLTVSNFISGLLAARDPSVVLTALHMVSILFQKLPGIFLKYFRREGVIAEIERLANLPDDAPVPAPPSPSVASPNPFVALGVPVSPQSAQQQRNAPAPATPSPAPAAPPEAAMTTRQLQKELAKKCVALKKEADLNAGFRKSSGINSGEPKELIELRNHVTTLTLASQQAPDGRKSDLAALERIAALLLDEEGISTWELLQSGLVPTLLQYLAPSASPAQHQQRVGIFLEAFKPAAMVELVRKLQEALNKADRFGVTLASDLGVPMSFAAPGAAAGLKFLTQPFRFKLVRAEGETTLKAFPNEQGIMLEPLATFRVLESFLLDRVKPQDGSVPPPPPPPTDDQGMFDEAPPPEEEPNPDDDPNNDDVDLDRFAHRAAAATLSSSSINVPKPPKVVFSLTGLDSYDLTPAMTVLHAVKKLHGCDDSASGSSGPSGADPSLGIGGGAPKRLWDPVYTLTYRSVTAAESVALSSTSGTLTNLNASALPPAVSPTASSLDELLLFLSRPDPVQLAPLAAKLKRDTAAEELQQNNSVSPYDILKLLRFLWAASKVTSSGLVMASSAASSVPPSEFLNNKIAGKLLTQIQDLFSVTSKSLPDWCGLLATWTPFLFPFDARRLYLVVTSFGLARALQHLQTSESAIQSPAHAMMLSGLMNPQQLQQQQLQIRLPRKKVRILRERVLDSAMKVLSMDGSTRSHILEVEYFGEVGTGLGPTLEFFTLVSRELQLKRLTMWYVEEESHTHTAVPSPAARDASYVHTKGGLFPQPYKEVPAAVKERFFFLGRFVAKALLDQRHLDLPLSEAFLRLAILDQSLGTRDLMSLAPNFARSILSLSKVCKQKLQLQHDPNLSAEQMTTKIAALRLEDAKIEDLGLDFTLPGQPQWELKPNGSQISVSVHNLDEYLQLVCDTFLHRGVQQQVDAFRSGLNSLLPIENLKMFTVSELEQMIMGGGDTPEFWTVDAISDAVLCDHGYSHQSRAVRFLFEVMSSMSAEERRQFLQFVTGSPRLPIGGFKVLNPRMTIVRKEHPVGTSDRYLPSVMTCANYLKLPDYSTKDITRQRILTAIFEGQSSFHLS